MSETSSTRNRSGRGRGRGAANFNWRKKGTVTKVEEEPVVSTQTEYRQIPSGDKDQKSEAKALVQKNKDAKPVTLKRFLSDWIQTKRRNVEIELSFNFARNLSASWITMSATFFKNYVESNLVSNVTHSTEALLYCGLAQKLIMANPKSEYPKLGIFAQIQNMEFYLPPKFITSIEVLGKSEEAHLRTKIMFNVTWAKRMIYNAVRHGILADPENRLGWFREESYDTKYKYDSIIFPDEDSLKWIKHYAYKWLSKVMEYKFKAKYGEQEMEVRVPALTEKDMLDKSKVIAWYNNIDKSKIFDGDTETSIDLKNSLMYTVVTSIMDIRYLLRPKDKLSSLDTVFDGTGLADVSTMTILANVGYNHIFSLCTEENLWRNFGLLTEELNETWIPIIQKVLKLEKYNVSNYGSMGLICKVADPKWYHVKRNILGKSSYLTHSNVEGSSIYQSQAYDGVAIGMMFGLVTDTTYKDNYIIKTDQPVESIRSNFVNSDFVEFRM